MKRFSILVLLAAVVVLLGIWLIPWGKGSQPEVAQAIYVDYPAYSPHPVGVPVYIGDIVPCGGWYGAYVIFEETATIKKHPISDAYVTIVNKGGIIIDEYDLVVQSSWVGASGNFVYLYATQTKYKNYAPSVGAQFAHYMSAIKVYNTALGVDYPQYISIYRRTTDTPYYVNSQYSPVECTYKDYLPQLWDGNGSMAQSTPFPTPNPYP